MHLYNTLLVAAENNMGFISETKWNTPGFNCGVLRTNEKSIDPAPCTRRYKYLLCAKNETLTSRNIILIIEYLIIESGLWNA